MAELRLELLLSPVEEISIFNSDTEIKVSDFSETQSEVFNEFVAFTGEDFAIINNILDEDIVVYWHKPFNCDEDYSIDAFYNRVSFDYDSLTESEKTIVDSFIDLIKSIR
jgi:hypothetical protein